MIAIVRLAAATSPFVSGEESAVRIRDDVGSVMSSMDYIGPALETLTCGKFSHYIFLAAGDTSLSLTRS